MFENVSLVSDCEYGENNMFMSDGEIAGRYRAAESESEQLYMLEVLSDLNAVPKRVIAGILKERGHRVPKYVDEEYICEDELDENTYTDADIRNYVKGMIPAETEKGLNDSEIAKKYGVSRSFVSYNRRKMGIPSQVEKARIA